MSSTRISHPFVRTSIWEQSPGALVAELKRLRLPWSNHQTNGSKKGAAVKDVLVMRLFRHKQGLLPVDEGDKPYPVKSNFYETYNVDLKKLFNKAFEEMPLAWYGQSGVNTPENLNTLVKEICSMECDVFSGDLLVSLLTEYQITGWKSPSSGFGVCDFERIHKFAMIAMKDFTSRPFVPVSGPAAALDQDSEAESDYEELSASEAKPSSKRRSAPAKSSSTRKSSRVNKAKSVATGTRKSSRISSRQSLAKQDSESEPNDDDEHDNSKQSNIKNTKVGMRRQEKPAAHLRRSARRSLPNMRNEGVHQAEPSSRPKRARRSLPTSFSKPFVLTSFYALSLDELAALLEETGLGLPRRFHKDALLTTLFREHQGLALPPETNGKQTDFSAMSLVQMKEALYDRETPLGSVDDGIMTRRNLHGLLNEVLVDEFGKDFLITLLVEKEETGFGMKNGGAFSIVDFERILENAPTVLEKAIQAEMKIKGSRGAIAAYRWVASKEGLGVFGVPEPYKQMPLRQKLVSHVDHTLNQAPKHPSSPAPASNIKRQKILEGMEGGVFKNQVLERDASTKDSVKDVLMKDASGNGPSNDDLSMGGAFKDSPGMNADIFKNQALKKDASTEYSTKDSLEKDASEGGSPKDDLSTGGASKDSPPKDGLAEGESVDDRMEMALRRTSDSLDRTSHFFEGTFEGTFDGAPQMD